MDLRLLLRVGGAGANAGAPPPNGSVATDDGAGAELAALGLT